MNTINFDNLKEEVEKKFWEKNKDKSFEDIMSIERSSPYNASPFCPSLYGYSYGQQLHLHENEVKNTFTGTYDEVIEKMNAAKELDKADKNICDANYRQAESILEGIFHDELAKYLGYNSESKEFAVIYSKAWEDGKSYGLGSVMYKAVDIDEFIDSWTAAKNADEIGKKE